MKKLLTAERDPRWIACVDFGTALSKVAMVRAKARGDIRKNDILPLAIGERENGGAVNPLLLPSVIFIDESKILFGQDAEEAALRAESRNRQPLRSLKQYLSTHELDELDHPLSSDIDPTGKFTARTCIELFLAYLLERAGTAAVRNGAPWPVRLRVARPAWERARAEQGEIALKSMVRRAFGVVDQLDRRITAGGGVDLDAALKALDVSGNPPKPPADDQIFMLSELGSATVLEATAVAAGSIRDTGRRVVAVADIGGGTSDFGAFMTGLRGRQVLAEIDGSAGALKQAGDHLDMLLTTFALSKLGYDPADAAGKGAANRIRRRQRQYKESLFSEGRVSIDAGEEVVSITVDEFISSPRVADFTARLRAHFDKTLAVAIECAQAHSPRAGGRAQVEIMLTGGGHELPMAKDLHQNPTRSWNYTAPAPDFAERPEDQDYVSARRQLVVAIGGAMRDLPVLTVPVRVPA